MGMFDKKEKLSKDEKQEAKAKELLARYQMENLSDQVDAEAVKQIIKSMADNSLLQLGTLMSGESEKNILWSINDMAENIVEQNFIIIRQLDRISKVLSK